MAEERFADFNLNDMVRVKLTDHGREALRINHTNRFSVMREGRIEELFPYSPPKEDEDGWSSWQLWDLMNTFGPWLGNGRHLPFETWMQIDFKSSIDGVIRYKREAPDA